MKRHLIPILIVMLVASGLLIGCVQETPQETPPDPRLIELHQTKLKQLEQINTELDSLRVEIHDIESELEKPMEGPKGIHRMTTEEIAAAVLGRPALKARLAELKEQEEDLLETKSSLEQDIVLLEILLGED